MLLRIERSSNYKSYNVSGLSCFANSYDCFLYFQEGFRLGSGVPLDSRVNAMLLLKTLPLDDLMTSVYPKLYSLTDLLSDVS